MTRMQPTHHLQKLMSRLPPPLKRMKIVRFLSFLLNSEYHIVEFQSGQLVGHISEGQVAHTLLTGYFADYGFFDLANAILHRSRATYFDVGANFGFHTFGLDLSSGINTYHLFEANPVCCTALKLSLVSSTADVRLFEGAIGDSDGRVSLRCNTGKSVEGYLTDNQDPDSYVVHQTTLDMYCELNSVTDIRLLKMDIEGSELRALKGAVGLLERSVVDYCYFEVNQAALERQGASMKELFDVFLSHEYRLFWPHTSTDWIEPRLVPGSATNNIFYDIDNPRHLFRELDHNYLRKDMIHQFDVLAVSPRVELVSSVSS